MNIQTQQKKEDEQTTINMPVKSVNAEESVSDRLTDNAEQGILPARYLRKNADGDVLEDPSDMFSRVAENVASAEETELDEKKWEQEFYDQMTELRFMPNSPTLMNAGTDMNQLSACFVLEPRDDMEDIFENAKDAALIFQSGGGVGYTFSHLRPKGAYIGSTGGEASGPVSFMRVYDETCNQVKQGGCIAASSRVMTDDGYKPLSSVHNAPPLRDSRGANKMVQARDGNLYNVVESSDSGPMPASKLITSSGYELVGTPNHKVLAVQDGSFEFVPIEELESGDTIVMDMTDVVGGSYSTFDSIEGSTHGNATIPNFPEKMTDDVARMLGTLWGDGAYNSSQNRLVFTFGKDGNGDTDAKDFIVDFFNEIGISPRVVDEEPKGKGAAWRVVVQSKNLITWMDKNGLDKKKDNISHIPEKVYESPNAISSFLGGLTCDAHVAEDAGTVTYSTADEEFAKLIQELLLLNGIPTNRYSIARNEASYSDKPCHCVQVFTGEYARQYDEKIPHYLDGDIGELGGERQNQVTFADELLTTVLGEYFEKGHKLPDHVDRMALKELRRYERGDRTPSKERLVDCLERVGIEIEEVPELDGEYLYEIIESIESVGEEYVYDIEVMDGAHEFVASNFIVHNKRRGAQMGILRVDHPDIGRFICAKRNEGKLSNFNISVAYTDPFIEAVRNDESYTLGDPEEDYESAYTVREATAKFYNPQYESNPRDAQEAQDDSNDLSGAVVKENFWRDYADEIPGIEDYRDEVEIVEGEPLTLPAQFIWEIMIDGAWRNGEPGLFHLDETNREHSFDVEDYSKHEIRATNPCVTGDTLVNTPDGLIRAENVEEGDEISTVLGSESVDEVLSFDNKDIFEVTLSDGGTIKATEDHRFHVLDGKSVDNNTPLRDLSEGDYLRLEPSTFDKEGTESDYKYQLRRGILIGDGGYTQKTIEQNNRLSISSSEDDKEFNKNIRELFKEAGYKVGELDTNGRNKSVKLWIANAEKILEDHNLDPAYSYEKSVDVTEFDTQMGVQGFLDGVLATDGSISMSSNRPQIRWATSSIELAKNLRNLALNSGMHARIYEDDRESRGGTRNDGTKIEDGRSLHNVHIAGQSGGKFAKQSRLDEYHPKKGELLRKLRTDYMMTGGLWKAQIKSIQKLDKQEKVYDLYASESDTWLTEGYVNRGCAEQPLSEYEACNLGHINLSLVLKENTKAFTDYEGGVQSYMSDTLDFNNLNRTILAGVRFLDNVVTQSDFPIEEIEERVSDQRKIGLGLMGFAQMLYQMGIPYGSDESYEVARYIMRYIDRRGTAASHRLAKDRGSFEVWDESKYANPQRYSDWFERHTGQPAEDYPDGYPIRNHNITTLAPTGTTSMIGNTSGGIEPVYSVANFKNVGDDIQGDDMLVEFDDYFLETLRANGIDVEKIKTEAEDLMRENEFSIDKLSIPEEIAEIFVTTQDLSPRQHGLMQRAFQEFCDSGISKTINMPNDATREDVEDAYLLALDEDDLGATIKGLTVYRDGSRNEQVLTTRVDNNLDDEDDDLLELYLKGEISETAARQLDVVSEEDEDSDTITCPECGDGELEKTDDCAMCPECFFSPCS